MLYYRKLPAFRFFKVNDNATLGEGDFKVFTLDGKTVHFQEDAIINFEISEEEAQSYLFNNWENQQKLADQQLEMLTAFLEMTHSSLETKGKTIQLHQKFHKQQQKALHSLQKELTEAKIEKTTAELEKFKDSKMLKQTAQHFIEQLKNYQSPEANNFDAERLKEVLTQFFEKKNS